MNLVFTICSNNYLAQAITLGYSLLHYNPTYQFKIGLVDRKRPNEIDYGVFPFEIIEVESIDIDDWTNMILRYNIQELNTAVKPFFFKYFLDHNKEFSNIIYLDPDIEVFHPFNDLEYELQINDIVVVPHFITPINDNKSPAENEILNTGLYNLGFLAMKSSDNSSAMIDWWAERLRTKGYNDVKNGMFTDQIWINFVPLFFKNVKVFTHLGYDVAYWNLHERQLSQQNNKYFVNSTFPLVFFHYSGYFPNKPEQMSKYQNRFVLQDLFECKNLFDSYGQKLLKNQYSFYQTFPCVFNGIKDKFDDDRVLLKVKEIPVTQRIIRKMILFIVKKFNIILDYKGFYDERTI